MVAVSKNKRIRPERASGVRRVRLGDVVRIDTSTPLPTTPKVWLLNLDMVEQQTGRLIDRLVVSRDDVGSSTVAFTDKHVLYSKLRPNLNKVVLPDRSGVGTSELLPLLCEADVLDRNYLCYFLRSPTFVSYAVGRVAGAKMPRLGSKDLLAATLPVPSLAEQRRIAAELDRIVRLKQNAEERLALLGQLVKSKFSEMFGEGDYLVKPLSEVADVIAGITKGRRLSSGTVTRTVPYLAVSNVKDGHINLEAVKTIDATEAEVDQYRLHPGDVLMTEGGDPDKLGRGAMIVNPPKDCIHQNHVFRVRVNRKILLPEYFARTLQDWRVKKYFLSCAKQTTGIASLNMRQLKALQVLLPPIKLQLKFAKYVAKVEKMQATLRETVAAVDQLYRGKLQECFG